MWHIEMNSFILLGFIGAPQVHVHLPPLLCWQRRGRLPAPPAWQEVRAALEPTPIPQTSYDTLGGGGHRSVWSTWFEVAHPLAPFNRAMEVRPGELGAHAAWPPRPPRTVQVEP